TAVGLVTFDDDGTLDVPLTHDLAGLRARIAALSAFGDTRPRPGIDAALAELTGPRADPAARKLIFIVTDGDWHDVPFDTAQRARAAGIDVYALIFPLSSYNGYMTNLFAQVTGDPSAGHVLIEPDAPALRSLLRTTGQYLPESGLFQRISVVDE